MKRYGWLIGLIMSSEVFAQAPVATGAGNAAPSAVAQISLLVGIGAVFYFFLIRPQNKRAKEHQQFIRNLKKDDEIVTNGGLLGKITNIGDNFFTVAIAEGVEVRIQKQAAAALLPKNTLNKVT